MQWDFSYRVAGEVLLAKAHYGVPCDTNFVRATLWREASAASARLAIVSRGEILPEAQAEPNNPAVNAAYEIQKTEDWIAVLAGADIRLRGEPAELHCSVKVDGAALPAEAERDAFLQGAIAIIGDAISCLIGVRMPPP